MYFCRRNGFRRRRRRGWSERPRSPLASKAREQVRRALGGGIQAKLTVGAPNDAHEQEADRVAEQVMRMPDDAVGAAPAGGQIQRACVGCEQELEEGKAQRLQRQPMEEEEQEVLPKLKEGMLQRQEEEEEEEEAQPKLKDAALQRQGTGEEEEEEALQARARPDGALTVSASVSDGIRARRGGGQPLSPHSRSFFEPRFRRDFSRVRVHRDAPDNALAESVGARAFTLGRDIFFGPGEFAPESFAGQRLLAHELTHVLQQNRGAGNEPGYLQRKVVGRRVSCEKYPRTYPIFTAIGTTDPVGVLQGAVTRAIAMLDDAIDELAYTRDQIIAGAPVASPTISDTVAVSLRERLRIDPDTESAWTGKGPRTVHHAIRWYRNIRRILDSDFMHYTCLDPQCDSDDVASAFAGESRIYLCSSFWSDTLDEQAITLIHEASHIYYDTEDSGRGMGNAYCLENFICDLQGISVCTGC